MVAIGLVITVVGLGDKGFKTIELKLVGPSLVGCGLFLAFLQVLYCTLPCRGETHSAQNDESEEKQLSARNKTGYVFVKPTNMQHTSDIQESKSTILPNTRPIIRATRQKQKSDNQDNARGTFPISANEDAELSPIKHHTRGSTKNLHNSDIILNSSRLFGNKEF
jgi:hypothetical protein